jgi:hypothetical protein
MYGGGWICARCGSCPSRQVQSTVTYSGGGRLLLSHSTNIHACNPRHQTMPFTRNTRFPLQYSIPRVILVARRRHASPHTWGWIAIAGAITWWWGRRHATTHTVHGCGTESHGRCSGSTYTTYRHGWHTTSSTPGLDRVLPVSISRPPVTAEVLPRPN